MCSNERRGEKDEERKKQERKGWNEGEKLRILRGMIYQTSFVKIKLWRGARLLSKDGSMYSSFCRSSGRGSSP